MSFDVIVVGAGITGLSAAVNIQKLIQRVNVIIIADHFGTETTTPASGSIFLPIPSKVKGVKPLTLNEWFKDSWIHHFEMAKSEEGRESGQSLMSGYCFWSHGGEHINPDAVFNYHRLSIAQKMELNFSYRHGCSFTTVVIDQKKYLRWLMKQFRERGGKLIHDTVYSIQELYGKCDVVVNCSGMRCRELVAISDVVPIKGNILEIETPRTQNFLITEEISLVPNPEEGVIHLGHLWQTNDHDSTQDGERVSLLFNIAKAWVPFLVGCEVRKTWTEKRPSRSPPLVQIEMLNCGGPILPVVHNIGLGELTTSLAWGTGVSVAHFVQDIQRKCKVFSRDMLPYHQLI